MTLLDVVGTWVQPAVSCTSGTPSYSAFWGSGSGVVPTRLRSRSSHRDGVELHVLENTAQYDAWYENPPAPPVRLKLTVRPGDTILAAVTITGKTVRFRLRNLTRKTVVNKKVAVAAPYLTSAEWIAQRAVSPRAPARAAWSAATVANFGSVDFVQAAATGSRHSGLIPDPALGGHGDSLDGLEERRAGLLFW